MPPLPPVLLPRPLRLPAPHQPLCACERSGHRTSEACRLIPSRNPCWRIPKCKQHSAQGFLKAPDQSMKADFRSFAVCCLLQNPSDDMQSLPPGSYAVSEEQKLRHPASSEADGSALRCSRMASWAWVKQTHPIRSYNGRNNCFQPRRALW